MDREMQLMEDMHIYELVVLPPGRCAIGSRWVLEYKEGNGKGGPVEKARFVAKGFTQVPGHDFGQTFTLVTHQSSICIITALCAHKGWELHSLNIKCTFLHGCIKEMVYMEQPHRYE
jgi:Reverse transcriptase (RNA-dependent DNA polymerase)